MEIASSQEEEMDEEGIFGGPYGQTPLHSAVANPDEISSRIYTHMLMTRKKELANKRDDDGRTALHYAAFFNFYRSASALLYEDTSSVYQEDKDGLYPIHLAAIEGNIDMIRLLLERCPDSRELLNRQGQNALHVAVMRGNEKSVTYMLKSPHLRRLIKEQDYEGNTPLHLATIHLQYKIVTIFTEDERVDMNAINGKRLTARDIAKEDLDKSVSVTKLLTLEALEKASAPFGRNRYISQRKIARKDLRMEYYKERSNTIVLVATLIATVTFAAGFTLPGGYFSDGPYQGTATMIKQPAFYIFLICNTVAMYLSIIIVLIHIWAQNTTSTLMLAIKKSLVMLAIALIAMAVAFMAGMYLVIVKLMWLSVLVLALGSIFLYCILVLITLVLRPVWIDYVFPWFIIIRWAIIVLKVIILFGLLPIMYLMYKFDLEDQCKCTDWLIQEMGDM